MSDLVGRYVHQVGRYLPPKERAEIEAELCSQIEDQLDDRYGSAATAEQTAAVLAEFGHPYQMAVSYSSGKYLVGPVLYPYMMLVLRYVWLIVPTTVIFLNAFGALTAAQTVTLPGFALETAWATVQATLMLSAVVVLVFALIQHSGMAFEEKNEPFNPLSLPAIDDPRVIDRYEVGFGITLSAVAGLVFLFFLAVGGLTLRFDLSNPGEVIPAPRGWLLLLSLTTFSIAALNAVVLRRRRWSLWSYVIEIALEVFGTICFYFAVSQPFFERLMDVNPDLSRLFFVAQGAEIIALAFAVFTLLGGGTKLVRLLA